MSRSDRQPLPNAAGTPLITPTANNRLGAVLSSLYSFWIARQAAVSHNAQLGGYRRDAYSIIFFSKDPLICVEHDFTSSPDELLTYCLGYKPGESENYTRAIRKAQDIMTSHWSTERCGPPLHGSLTSTTRETDWYHRAPVLIFLSDGQSHIEDKPMYDICRDAARHRLVALRLRSQVTDNIHARMPLSFHAITFGPEHRSDVLRRMVQIANEVENSASRNSLTNGIASSFAKALDTVSVECLQPSETDISFIRSN